jgi:hypothetical protein
MSIEAITTIISVVLTLATCALVYATYGVVGATKGLTTATDALRESAEKAESTRLRYVKAMATINARNEVRGQVPRVVALVSHEDKSIYVVNDERSPIVITDLTIMAAPGQTILERAGNLLPAGNHLVRPVDERRFEVPAGRIPDVEQYVEMRFEFECGGHREWQQIADYDLRPASGWPDPTAGFH